MEKQLHGSNVPLNTRGPLNVEPDGNTRGGFEIQTGASQADIHTRPFPLMPLNEGTRNGERQMHGSEAPLDHTPRHGWQSDYAPVSERAKRQSE